MAKIQTLKNKENVIVYPQTHGTAVFVNEGEILQDKIEQYLTSEEVGEVENVDITAELTSNKVTSIRDTSTDLQYPSAKAVYDFVSNMQVDIDSMKGFKSLTASMDNPVDLDSLIESGIYVIDGVLAYVFNGPDGIDEYLSAKVEVYESKYETQQVQILTVYTTEMGVIRYNEYHRFYRWGAWEPWSDEMVDSSTIIYVNDCIKGFATKSEISNLAKKSEIPDVPTAVSELSNDKNYVASAAASPILVKYSWYGTQAQYDALASLDSNTEYNIIEE